MSWFADLAGRAENLLNNLDEQTGAALRNHNPSKKKHDVGELSVAHFRNETITEQKKRTGIRRPESKSPSRKASPISNRQPRIDVPREDYREPKKSRKSPSRKSSPMYSLDHPPRTLVGDVKENDKVSKHPGLRHRRSSLPTDLELLQDSDFIYKMQNLEVENAMLVNEVNVMNTEVAELWDKLHKTEDGNDVDGREMAHTRMALETTTLLNSQRIEEKTALMSQMEQVKQKIQELTGTEVTKYREEIKSLETEVGLLRQTNRDLEDVCKDMTTKLHEKETAQMKLENDLRHAQSTVADLQSNLSKSSDECRRLEKDWEAYKLRVKNMLHAKDNEIKKLQEGVNLTQDTKELLEQIDCLRIERDELSDKISLTRNELDDVKQYLQQTEARLNAAERVVSALRDALRDERAARNQAEAQWITAAKELKSLQIETGHVIASLRTVIRDKDNEIHRLQEANSTVRTTDTSTLNVGDYGTDHSIDNNKIQHLTETLVLRQSKIDKLIADNNMLKIQLEKLQTKYKTEIAAARMNSHSVVHLQDGDVRQRLRTNAASSLSGFSVRLGVMVKRYPIVRIFIIVYMACLHFWVLTVLFTNTPDDNTARASKS